MSRGLGSTREGKWGSLASAAIGAECTVSKIQQTGIEIQRNRWRTNSKLLDTGWMAALEGGG